MVNARAPDSRPSADGFDDLHRKTIELGFVGQQQLGEHWTRLQQHPVCAWLSANPNFQSAKRIFETSSEYEKNKQRGIPDVWQRSQFVGLIASALATYVLAREQPERIRVLHKTIRRKALKHISELVRLMGHGVGFLDNQKSEQLLALLCSLSDEIRADVPLRIQKRRDKDLPIRLSVRVLARISVIEGDSLSTGLIVSVLSIVDANINERTVQRIVASVRAESEAYRRLYGDRKSREI